MALVSIARWVLLLLLRHPLTWLWIVVLAGLWPAVAALTPLGLATSAGTEAGTLYEVAFIALLTGQVFGLAVLHPGRWFLAGTSAWRRIGVEVTALTIAASVFVASALGLAWALGAPPAGLLSGALPAAVLLAHVHLCAVSLILMRSSLPPAGLVLTLLATTWLLPAVVGPGSALGNVARHVLGASRHLSFPSETDPAGSQWIPAILPIIGLIGVATLLASSAHALRHTR